MTDTTQRTGSAGLQPGNIIAANTYNPTAGASAARPNRVSFPPGTPVVQSLAADHTAIPGRANDVATSSLTGLAVGPGVVGEPVFVQFSGVLTLTTDQWDAITGGSGGLVKGEPYFLSPGFQEGQLVQTAPVSPFFVAQAGVALSPTDFLIQICAPTPGV